MNAVFTEAYNIIFSIFIKFGKWLFDSAVLGGGISLGYIFVSVLVCGFLISSLLRVPSSAPTYKVRKEREK